MDQDRQIRFLIPPFVFFLSLFWGAILSDYDFGQIESDFSKNIIALLAIGIATAIALGFIIGAISIFFLRIFFKIFCNSSYEVSHSIKVQKRIWSHLNTDLKFNIDKALYADATFDHEIISKGTHDWVTRRWSSFNISANSCTAIILSHFFNSHSTIM